MKAVMISIQPKWVEKIANGQKTIEVRKTRPKIDTPFRCYIYCTKGENLWLTQKGVKSKTELAGYLMNGKVIGEFVCDSIYDITPHCDIPTFVNQYECDWKYGEAEHCLSFDELKAYLNNKNGYGWHISDLVIYDEPKELSEFKHCCPTTDGCKQCKYLEVEYNGYFCECNLTRPPMSWCYVEEKEESND